ncbi:MAG TPA: 3-dehydroquinate synthase, partial [Longimicrobiales bacterium]|nr:3-dehydroquinate synthase [Longimicrobiales bacterium]
MSDRVRISTKSTAADYEVVIEPGGIDQLAGYVDQHARAHKYAIISDSNVAPRYGQQALRALKQADLKAQLFSFPAGEANKTVQRWEQLSFDLLFEGFGRDTTIIAIGGGVTGDLAGFIAATYMRGVPIVQVPTSLLAMIDASIGGKTGVDAPAGKNLIGAFHQPAVVVIDPLVLNTLPDDELRNGLAEAIKHGAIADAAYLATIPKSIDAIFQRDPAALNALIKRSVELKARHVSEDVHEAGARAALNFGHTIGHALEHVSHFALPHGSAVALGMVAEAAAGELIGITERGTAEQLKHVIG